MFYVYTYFLDDVPRYVGKGVGGRWTKHRTLRTRFGSVLREDFVVKGQWSIPRIQNCASEQEAHDLEARLIAKYGRLCRGTGSLYNITAGGQGSLGRTQTETTREKIRKSFLGKKHTAQTKEKLRQILLARDPTIYDKVSETSRGHKKSEKTKAKIQAAALVREANKRKERLNGTCIFKRI